MVKNLFQTSGKEWKYSSLKITKHQLETGNGLHFVFKTEIWSLEAREDQGSEPSSAAEDVVFFSACAGLSFSAVTQESEQVVSKLF